MASPDRRALGIPDTASPVQYPADPRIATTGPDPFPGNGIGAAGVDRADARRMHQDAEPVRFRDDLKALSRVRKSKSGWTGQSAACPGCAGRRVRGTLRSLRRLDLP